MLVSVGGEVSEGILASLADCRDRLLIVGTTTDPTTRSARQCDVIVQVAPSIDVASFVRDVAEALRVHRPIVAFPCRDADMPGLAKVKADDPVLGAPLLVGSVALANAMSDKVLMKGFMERCRLPIPATAWTFDGALELAGRYGFPLIAKPRVGSGTKGVYIVLDDEQLRSCALHGDFVIQPFISPPPDFVANLPDPRFGVPFVQSSGFTALIALRGLVGRDGRLDHVVKVDVVHRYGRPFRLTRCPVDAVDHEAAQRVAAELHCEGYVGPFALQGRVDDNGALVFFEMLARIGGSALGFVGLGLNQSRIVLEMFGGPAAVASKVTADSVEWQTIPRAFDDRVVS
ncbi:MAG: hypothetical protein RLO51_08760 [Thalassobaculum sp.]|uniref:hypothetical protein n=1 Tax=Thalassobaculum sp. TaxID=2022740 RepID=UPI0032EC593F